LVEKLIDEDIVCQKAIAELAVQFDNASISEKETRTRSLPLNQPLNSYGLHTLLMTSKSDRHITTALEAAREEVLRCIDEKQELINNYRAI
nr:hypothetical protein [Tanacetum cinerariifolium]